MNDFASKWTSWNQPPPNQASAKGAKSPTAPSSGTNGTSSSGGARKSEAQFDDLLVQALGYKASVAISCQQVKEAWESLTPAQMTAIPEAKINQAKALSLKTDSMAGLLEWFNFEMQMIEEASHA